MPRRRSRTPRLTGANRDLASIIDEEIEPFTDLVDWWEKDDIQREMHRKIKRQLRASGLASGQLDPLSSRDRGSRQGAARAMMATETSEIQFGQTGISYKIRRSPRRRKTVEVTVDPRQGVVVAAPERVPTGRLDSIVRQKARWILERQRRFQQANPAIAPREFVSGESVWYLGRHYRLKVLANPNRAKASLVGGWLRVPRHSTPATRDGSEVVRASVIAWYHQRATTRLPERVARWCGKVGVAMPALVVRRSAEALGELLVPRDSAAQLAHRASPHAGSWTTSWSTNSRISSIRDTGWTTGEHWGR